MKALVTGGGGFLGLALARGLKSLGHEVRTFSRGGHPLLRKEGFDHIRGDLADPDSITRAADGCDIVFHVAAKAGVWGPYADYYRANVLGTRNVIAACRQNRIDRLVYTSTPSVVYKGVDEEGIDESAPYPDKFEAPYPGTKAEAEQLVLAANDDALATVALRPHLVWGPGDPNFLPRLVERARAGRLRKVTGGPYLVDHVFIDNAVQAHVLAADRLAPGSAITGRPYFITNGEPIDVWDLIDRLLDAAGAPRVEKSVSPVVARTAGTVLETIYKIFHIKKEPPMTRFVAKQISTAHWFDISAAQRDLGYNPGVSLEQGLVLFRQWVEANSLSI